MSHTCHAPGCNRLVPPKMFACKPHWFALPQKIRDAIWREYRSGQEISKRPSLRYLAVQRLACAHLSTSPLTYIQEALRFRALAIEAQLGDPLEGLIPDEPVKKAKKKRKKVVS